MGLHGDLERREGYGRQFAGLRPGAIPLFVK